MREYFRATMREREREMGSRRRREVTRVTFFFTLGGLAHVKWRSRPRERPRSALSTSNGGRFQPFNATSASFLPRCANGFRATIAFSPPPPPPLLESLADSCFVVSQQPSELTPYCVLRSIFRDRPVRLPIVLYPLFFFFAN